MFLYSLILASTLSNPISVLSFWNVSSYLGATGASPSMPRVSSANPSIFSAGASPSNGSKFLRAFNSSCCLLRYSVISADVAGVFCGTAVVGVGVGVCAGACVDAPPPRRVSGITNFCPAYIVYLLLSLFA